MYVVLRMYDEPEYDASKMSFVKVDSVHTFKEDAKARKAKLTERARRGTIHIRRVEGVNEADYMK